ncbi:MAG: hypothetical protein GDA43_05130 [Hormoscilla sp. SP5CHS1]|nr:hypothetical protein [Hormoscilla sp. SP12CHS1]MBC6452650.1 hypothetical protein [Hormoscilla sp. SP5CHS1]MBC6472653.1 hypothetical protein [Hormoscilla sp. GM102CHS1]
MGTIGLGDQVHQVDYTIGCPFLAAGDCHPVRPGVTTGDRRFGAGGDRLGENGGRKGIEKKAIALRARYANGHYSKKILARQVDRAKALAVGQGYGTMPDIAPLPESGPEQAKMMKKVRT